MEVSRRGLLAAGGVAGVSAATPMPIGADAKKTLVDHTVTRLSWMFTQPSSHNTNWGFHVRKGDMRGHLSDYVRLFETWFDRPPTPEHLFAAGTVIHNNDPRLMISSRGQRRMQVTEENFSRIWAVAHQRVRAVPELAHSEADPFPDTPAAALQADVVVAGEPETVVLHRSNKKLADLAWYLGSSSQAIDAAIGHLWADFAFIKGFARRKPNGEPPTPREAWLLLRRRSEQQRLAWERRVARESAET
jgi:hypothetical protein